MLQREGLICGENELSYVSSNDYEPGRVMWQSYAAGTTVIQGTQVYLQISTGPAVTPVPAQPAQPQQEAAPAPEG